MARIKYIARTARSAAAGGLLLFFPGAAFAADAPAVREAELRVVAALSGSTSPATGLQPFREGELWGYRNAADETVIPPVFDRAEEFREGLAPVMLNGKWGYIDESGRMRLEPRYDGWNHFSGGRAGVKLNGEWVVIDGSGTVVERPFARVRSDFVEGRAFFKSGEKFGYLDPAGAVKIAPAFDDARDFSDGLAAVKKGKWGFIDKNGKVAVQPGFEAVGRFREGLAAFLREGAWGFLNRKGRVEIGSNFDDVREFSEGLAAVRLASKWGYIDKTGRIAIRPQYAQAQDFSAGRAVVTVSPAPGASARRWIDRQGSTLFQSSGAERDGMQPVAAPDGRYGYAGSSDIVLAPGFEEAKACLDKLCLVRKNGKYVFIDYAGRIMLETSYEDASEAFCGFYRVKRGGKYGFIDSAGAVAVPLIYDVLEMDSCREEIKAVLDGRPGVLRRPDRWRFVQDAAPAQPVAVVQAEGSFPGGTAMPAQALVSGTTAQASAAEPPAASSAAAQASLPEDGFVRENKAGYLVAFELNVKLRKLPIKTSLPVNVRLKRRFNGQVRVYSTDMNKLMLLDAKRGEYLKNAVLELNGVPGKMYTVYIGLSPGQEFPGLLLGAEVLDTASLQDKRYHARTVEKETVEAPPGGDWFRDRPLEEMLLDTENRFSVARAEMILSSDTARAEAALPQLVRWFMLAGAQKAAAEDGLKTIIRAHGGAMAVPHVNALLRDNDLRNRIKWLEALRLCGPAAVAAVEEIRVVCDDDDPALRSAARALYNDLFLQVPAAVAFASAGLPVPDAAALQTATAAPAVVAAATAPAAEYAAVVSTADAARAIEAAEKALESAPPGEESAKLYLQLGRLKKAAESDADYAKRFPGEYACDEAGGRYLYNGRHFMRLLMQFPESAPADEAAYALTELTAGGECEGFTDRCIERQFGRVSQFLKDRPGSRFAPEAVTRANEAFTANLKDVADYNVPGRKYSPEKVKELLRLYDNLAALFPRNIRAKAFLPIAGLWAKFQDYDRAKQIYRAILADEPDEASALAAKNGLAAIPSGEFVLAPVKVSGSAPPELEWTALKSDESPEYAVYRSSDSPPAGQAPANFTRLARVQGTQFSDITARPGAAYWYYVEAVTSKGAVPSNKVYCKLPDPAAPVGP